MSDDGLMIENGTTAEAAVFVLPASFAQRRLWFIDQLEPGSSLYNVPLALRLIGELDAAALVAALTALVERHEALRTTLAVESEEIVQVVATRSVGACDFAAAALDALPAGRREGEARRRVDAFARRPFDLERGPLFRALLVRLDATTHVLALVLHHAVTDGASLAILLEELKAFYDACETADAAELPELPIQYGDFALWQREELAGEAGEAQLAYWRRQLDGAPPHLELAIARPRRGQEGSRGDHHSRLLPAPLAAAVDALGRAHGASRFMVLLAAFKALLARHGAASDIVVGTPVAGRQRVETEGLIGLFVNILALRTEVAGAHGFAEHVGRVRDVVLDALAHQDLPFEQLVEALEVERALRSQPLVQVVFSLVERARDPARLGSLAVERLPVELGTAKFDLGFTVEDTARGLLARVDFRRDLYAGDAMARLLASFEALLSAALADPERAVAALPVLPRAARHQVLAEWNDARDPVVPAAPVHREAAAWAARIPDAVAVVDESAGCRALSYGALASLAGGLAQRLRAAGVGPDVVVGICLERSLELVVGALAVLEAGGAYLPLDPALPDERLTFMIDDAGVPVLLGDGKRLAGIEPARRPIAVDVSRRTAGSAPRVPVEAESLAYVIYTSGSTGRPKGTELCHRGLAGLIAWHRSTYRPSAADRATLLAAPGFDASVWELWSALAAGAALLVPPSEVVASAGDLVAWLDARRVTLSFLPTPLAEAVLAMSDLPARPTLRTLLTGGDKLSPVRADLPFALVNHYGPTESSVVATWGPAAAGPAAPPIGRPLSGLRVRLLDAALEPVPVGVPGELSIAGQGLARGYRGRPALTAERFLPDPFAASPGGRLYRTGDLTRLRADGQIEFVERRDHQVKVRGFRIELGEIEAVLGTLAGVEQAVVTARAGAGEGETAGERRLAAYVVPAAGFGGEAVEVWRAALGERLPEYMVPAAFVLLDALPLTPNGKVDRRALPEPQWRAPGVAFVAPRGPHEELVAEVWREVLGHAAVSVYDDFFELGGHSLKATQVASRLRRVSGVELRVREVFEAPTVAALAARLAAATGRPTPPIVAVPRDAPPPASFAQERLWFLDRFESDRAVYNVPTAQRLAGALDAAALAAALAALARRHETLRTVFEDAAGQVVQVVQPAAPVPLPAIDLGGAAPARRETEARRLARREARRTFDLARGPLWRAVLLRLAPDEHVLLLTLHHVISDGWSMTVLWRELDALYGAALSGETPPLPPLPIQYADFAAWQRRWLSGEELERQLGYWRRRLEGLPPVLELPLDRPRPAVQTSRGGEVATSLPADLTAAVRRLAGERGASLFMVLLAAFQAVLGRLSGQRDLAVGTAIANRNRLEIEGLIGFFVNTLVLRGDLGGDPSFGELLARTRESTLDAYAHQDLPFEKLVGELVRRRDLSHPPLVQVLFVLQNAPPATARLGGLARAPFAAGEETARLDLSLGFRERGGELVGGVEHNRDLFDATTVKRLLGQLRTLLAAAAREPDRPLSRLPLLAAGERQQLLAEWCHGGAAPAPAATLHGLFGAQAERTPEAVALVAGHERLTYRRLARRARRLACRLRALGVGPEVRVGVCLDRQADLVVTLLAVLEAGGAYVPLDPTYPLARLETILDDATAGTRASAVVTRTAFVDRLPRCGVSSGLRAVFLDRDAGAADETAAGAAAAAAPAGLAYLIYTSGSTGRPKGVAVTHAGAVALVDWARRVFSPAELARVLGATSINFDLSVFEIFVTLAAGGTLVLVDDALALAETPAAGAVTLVNTVPSAMAELARLEALPASVLTVNLAGEPLKRRLADAVFAARPGCRLYNLYGPSEDATYSTFARVGAGAAEPTIGRPVDGTSAQVLDRALRPRPLGAAGELALGGRGLARGYLRRPALTAAVFVPDPFAAEPGERLYRTGDLARWRAGGELEHLGRADHQVKVRGFRIELGEIEAHLARHGAVRDAAAIAHRDGDAVRILAYVVGDAGTDELRRYLQAALPEHMVPSLFVSLAQLPHTATGKVDRGALPAPSCEFAGDDGFVAPRGPREELVAEVWREVLGRDAVGVHDDFFALGGHSLKATQVVSRLRRVSGVELPVRALFEAPTVAQLAARLAAGGGDRPAPPIAAVPRDAPLPASFAQERLWFLDRFESDLAVYNVPTAQRLTGALDAAALAAALAALALRHETLRTVFEYAGDEVVQVVRAPAPAPAPLPLVDLGGREAEARRLARLEARRTFDLARGPLWRAVLLRLAEDEHVLLLTLHHVISDGWSLGVLWRELDALYGAFAEGRLSPLRPLPIQYADFAAWQRRWLSGEELERQLGYWRRRLEGLPPVLELPLDRPRPAVQTSRGGEVTTGLPAAETAALRELAGASGASLFMVLLAAFQAVLGRLSGQRDLAVGTAIANRNRLEIEGLIGFFVNTLALRGDLGGDPSFGELLARTRESTLDAYAHQDLPFEKLVGELVERRDLSHPPLVQVLFVLQNAPPATARLGGLARAPFAAGGETARLDLSLAFREGGGELVGGVEHNLDLFDATTVKRLLGQLRTLLAAAAREPDRPLSRLSLLGAGQRQQMLTEWNDRRSSPPRQAIATLFAAQAAATPDAVAVASAAAADAEALTYGELDRRADRLAHRLRALGVGPQAPLVGLCMDRCVEQVVALVAILKAGGAYLPLDPAYPRERLALMFDDGAVEVLIAHRHLLGELPADLLAARETRIVYPEDDLPAAPASAVPAAGEPDALAYVVYTSGSTGRPKGVAVAQKSVVRLVRATDFIRFGAEERYLQLAPVAFDASTLELWGSLLNGARLVVFPPHAPSLHELASVLRTERISTLWLTAGLFHQMVDEELASLLGVGQLLAGGEALSPAHVRRVLAELPPGYRLVNGYGPTENTTFTTTHAMTRGERPGDPVPLGRPVRNGIAHVLDRSLEPVPIGVPGELCMGGDGLARGYLRRPALTADRFVPDPLAPMPGERLYRSGDLARYRADGTLDFLGRLDRQVKLRGLRVEPGEIEARLGEHPDVQQAAVLVAGSGGDRRLVAFVVAPPRPAEAELRRFLEARLPAFMVPAVFVRLDELPLNANGKVDRTALAALAETDLPPGERAEDVFVAPRGPHEALVAEVWREVLGHEAVSVHDDFFALGGHSLKATQVVSRLRRASGAELPVRAIFEAPTVAALAVRLAAAQGAGPAPAIEPEPRTAPLPASFAQERLWFLDRFDPGTSALGIPAVVHLRGRLRAGVLRQALTAIVARHESLRTTFGAHDGRPVQNVAPARETPLPQVDLGALSAARRRNESAALGAAWARHAFDLARGPLFVCRLLRIADDEHQLLVNLHHAVADGWSLGILLRELRALYDAFAEGRPSPLPPLVAQYADFAVWQRRWLDDEQLGHELDYWRRQLEGVPPALELETDRPRRGRHGYQDGSVQQTLPPALTGSLKALAGAEGATLFMVLLAALDVLLCRHSGQHDVAVGTPIAGRQRSEVEGLIGCFLNTLVMRVNLAGAATFRALLARVREVALGAYAHQTVPFERLLEELPVARSLDRPPIFQVFLNVLNFPYRAGEASGLEMRLAATGDVQSKFDLTLYVRELDDGVALSLVYDADLFDRSRVEVFADQLTAILEQAIDDPERPIDQLSLLTASARRMLADPTAILAKPALPPAAALLAEAAARYGEAPAIRHRGRMRSYGELWRAAGAIRGALAAAGFAAGDVVALGGPRSVGLIAGMVAILSGGGVLLFLDRRLPTARQRLILDVAGARLLVAVEDRAAAGVPAAAAGLRQVEVDAASGLPAENGHGEPPVAVPGADDPAYVFFTSGSTGVPKGVVGRQAGLSHFLLWQRETFGVGPGDRFAQLTAPSFDVVLRDVLLPLISGATLCLPEVEDDLSGERILPWLETEAVTRLHTVPTVARGWLAAAAPGIALAALRHVFFAGEPLTDELVRRWRRAFPRSGELINLYGPTETTLAKFWYRVGKEPAPGVQPIGWPLPETQALVVAEGNRRCGIGEAGEILIRTPFRSLGYLADPEGNAQRFVPNPWRPDDSADRLYRSGDRGRVRHDGTLAILGRTDHQVKIRGVRVELAEVETVLGRHPDLEHVTVSARALGAGEEKHLVAYVLTRRGVRLDPAALRAFAARDLPEALVPSAFVALEAVPQLPTGKVDRAALDRLAVPAGSGDERLEDAPAPPVTPTEEVLAALWCQVLGHERIGRRDDFFALGGHSLLATRLVVRIAGAFGVDLPVRGLFETPVLADLAGRIDELRAGPSADEDAAPPLVAAADRDAATPLSFAQERLWILSRLEPSASAAYNIPIALRLDGDALDLGCLAAALADVGRRHDVLRARFQSAAGEPVQVVAPAASHRVALPLADLRPLAAARGREAADAEARRLVAREGEIPFDLERGPLERALLLRLANDCHVLLVTIHHVTSDGWSTGILFRELTAFYRARVSGEPAALPPLPVQYGDFARWQRGWLRGPALERQMAFWRRQLAGAPTRLELPTDRPRPAVQSFRGARLDVAFPAALGRDLAALARASGSSLFMVLLAGYQALLGRYANQDDVSVGTPIANRTRVEVEGLIGFFVNTLVLRGRIDAAASFGDLVGQLRESALDAYAHQDVPFEKLVEALNPQRELSHAPLFQAMLVLQNMAPPAAELPGLVARGFEVERRTAKFDLNLVMAETPAGLRGYLEYCVDLFDRTTAARLARHLGTLYQQAVARPDAPLEELPLLDAAEVAQLIREWNDTARAGRRDDCLHQPLEERATAAPDRAALVVGGGDDPRRRTLSYGELDRLANRLARHLRSLGAGPGTLVGVFLDRRAELVVAILAVLKVGAAYVPLEGSWPADRINTILTESGIRHLITEAARRDRLEGLHGLGDVIVVDRIAAGHAWPPPGARLTTAADVAACDDRPLPPAPGPGADGLAYVIFTSGSTGKPKGVVVRHRPAVNLIRWVNHRFGVGPGDRLLFVTALSFDLSVYDVFGTLGAGATVRLTTSAEARDPQGLVRLLEAERITFWDSAPATLQQLAPFFPPPPERAGALRLVFLSGDWIPVTLPGRVRSAFPGARVISLGGATEATVWSNFFPVGRVDPAWASIPYGRPIENARYHVLDRRLEPCPTGVPGDLYIGGECLSAGYAVQPALTADRYLPDPFSDAGGDRLYRTGDRSRYRADGNLEFLGRLDTQVKVRGFRIELGEIESVLAGHPAIHEAVALVREETPGDQRIVAHLLPAGDTAPDVDELRALVRGKLPEYMVPAAYVVRRSWPLSPTGKLDRAALAREALTAAPAAKPDATPPAAAMAPRGGLEETLAAIWRDVIGIEAVGIDDNFFEIGGHSVLVIRVHARLREALGVELSVVDLFQHPTIRGLADFLRPEAAPTPETVPAPAPRADDPAVAVVGMAGRFPGAADLETFWANLRAGVESIRFFSDEELLAAGADPAWLDDPQLVKARGALDDPDRFDAAFFGYSPREAQIIDPQQRLFLEAAWEAMETAGYSGDGARRRVGVFAGASESTYAHELYRNRELVATVGRRQVVIANNADYLATRVAYKLELSGPALAVQTACSTSLVAVHQACVALRIGDCDLALAGGSSVSVREVMPYRYEPGGVSSPDGHVRAFDARAQGMVGGSGVGVVVLKRLADALADGDTIHAVIRGTAVNNDGADKAGFTAPSVGGQAAVIRQAQRLAGVTPESIQYVEAHGTGTTLGDPIEVAGLTQAFRDGGSADGTCAIGSVKTNIGHLDAAAGIAGLIKTVLALGHREIPPSLHFETPNPEIDFAAGPFRVNAALTPWPRTGGAPRRAAVSAFGIGGTNAHAVLEEAPVPAPADEGRAAQLLVVSARTANALERLCADLAGHLERCPETALGDAAFTLQAGRKVFPYRRAVTADSRAQAITALRGEAPERVADRAPDPDAALDRRPEVAFLFPGQGAQHPGMAAALYRGEPVFRDAVDHCVKVLDGELDADLPGLLTAAGDGGAAERLEQTALAQPALFVVSYALARLWQSWGVRPAALLGHSIGEYVAACLAGVFELDDALRLVAARGRLMQSMPAGEMLAVGLPEADLLRILESHRGLDLAAVNGPAACVVSGPAAVIAALARELPAGAGAKPLHTSHAFHSAMMEPVVEPFVALVATLERRAPSVPFVSNVTGAWITAAEATDPAYWGRHLRRAVRFADGVETLLETRRALLEVGPGRSLSMLARQHPARGQAVAIQHSLRHPRDPHTDWDRLLAAAGGLWLHGAALDWPAFHAPARRRRVPLPTYPFERGRYWLDGVEAPAEERAPAVAGAALSEVEERVAEAWRALLGVEEIAPHHDFFDLGGSSLMAVQLGSQLRRALDVDLGSDFLLAAPTLGAQAALIEKARGAEGAATPAPRSCLIKLQAGQPGRAPLFCVHQVGGHVYSFRPLVKLLGPAQPVYGLRSLGLEDGETPLTTVGAMAEHYLALVREVQGTGPYGLCGASMGGVVALEMAQRLLAAGEEVALLTVMDTPIGSQMPRRPRTRVELLAQVFHGRAALTHEEVAGLGDDAVIDYALAKAQRVGAVGPLDRAELERLLRVVGANVAALFDYRPRPYNGRILLFRAADRPAGDARRIELAWIELALGGLDFVLAAGNHVTMHEPPHVEGMAVELARYLERPRSAGPDVSSGSPRPAGESL